MSDLPPSRRDEREAELAEIEARYEYANVRGTWSVWRIGSLVCHDVPWLIAEVRSLSQQLDEAKADIATDDIRLVGRTLGFLKSVIHSGESWTAECQDSYRKAGDALDRIGDAARVQPASPRA